MLLTTALVTVLPAIAVRIVLPAGDVISTAASVALVIALSLAVASAEAALWKRWRRSRDIVFADLMIWGWARRVWTERRLARARELLREAQRADRVSSIETLTRVSQLLEARDAYTHGHSDRVMRHAGRIAHAMGLPAAEIAKIRIAAAVHDVGKLHTPREIINNPAPLSDAEYEIMKRHAADGADMLAGMGAPDIAAMVRHHHERVNGSGYPAGLSGSEIPRGARIIAVADTFDAITSTRPYRGAASQKRALKILSAEADVNLDKAAVAAFLGHCSSRRSVAAFAFAATLPQVALAALRTTTSSLAVGVGGLASIVPALGAAGGLALTHASHAAVSRSAAPARSAHVTSAARTRTSAEGASRRASTKHAGNQRALRRGHGGASHGGTGTVRASAPSPTHATSKLKTVIPSGPATHTQTPTKQKPTPTTTTPAGTTTTTPTTPTETTPQRKPGPLPVEVPATVTTPSGGTVEVPTKVPSIPKGG